MKNLHGVQLIAKERQKQIDKHGFTGQHHANHPELYEENQLTVAAASMLLQDLAATDLTSDVPKNWDDQWFLNLLDREPKERLIIAGALIAAELDRLQELEKQTL